MASIATSYRPLRPDDEYGLQPNPLAAQMPQPQHALALPQPVTPADLNAPVQQDPGFGHFLATEAAKSRSDLSPDASPLERAAVPLADQVKSADHENPVSPFAVFGGALGASLAGRQMNTEPYDQAIDLDRKDRATAKVEAEKKAKEQLAARRQDPNSEESMTAQISMGPMLKQLGFADDEIRSLSADDIRDMGKGGNLALSMVEARSRAAQRADQLKANEAKVATENAEWDRRNGVTSQQELERARVMAGMSEGRMVQGALLQDALQGARQETAAERAEQQRIAAEQRAHERETEKEKRTQENKEADEVVALNRLRKQLEARSPDDELPGQENPLSKTLIGAKASLTGGTGRSSDDSALDTDLTALGLQAYMNKAHNAPNSTREQEIANGMFRGNGTVGSAMARIDQRLAEIEQTRAVRSANVGTTDRVPKVPGAKPPAGLDAGMVRVRRKADGKTGTMPLKNVDPSKYEVIK
jgi:hypothetical protein